MYIEICQKNYLKLGNNYGIGIGLGYGLGIGIGLGGIRTFRSSVFSLLGAKVPSENFRSEERKYRGAKSP